MSAYVDKASMQAFETALRKTADLTGRLLVDVLKQQAGLVARDAMRLTPPFAKHPFKESFGAQRKIGSDAIEKDVAMTFKPLSGYRIVGREWHFEHGDIGLQIKKAVRGGKRQDLNLAEALLNKVGLKPLAVIHNATLELHQQKGGRQHRVKGRSYRVVNASSINKVKKHLLSQVGEAKAGWVKSIRKFGKIDSGLGWVTRHGEGSGIASEQPSQDKPSVTVGNSIAYVQDRAPEIVDVVWAFRVQAAKLQAKHIERAMKKKAAESGVTVT